MTDGRAPETIVSRFFANADRLGSRPSHYFKRDGRWVPVGWRSAAAIVRNVAAGLIDCGHKPGDAVAILSATRREWLYSDLGNLAAGGISVGVYPSMTPDQTHYVIAHADCRFAVVEDAKQLTKLRAGISAGRFPKLTMTFVIDTTGASLDPARELPFRELVRRGQRARNDADARRAALTLEQAAIFVYTSGTTGPPKGAMITHGNVVSAMTSMQAMRLESTDVGFSFLPLAHVLQRAVDYYAIWNGCSGYYGEGIDKIADNLAETSPTVVAAVPRIFEKVHARIHAQVASSSAARQRIFKWAIGVGSQISRLRQAGRPIPPALEVRHRIARRLVFDKLRQRLGGKIRLFVTGGAPIAKDILEFFDSADITILEGWGMTETFAAGTSNLPGASRFGTIGRPLPGIQLRLDSDGEILIKGGNLFAGYFKDEAATREVWTPDGYFRTGDIGKVDPDGFYSIVDRKKDILITAAGKNIAPQNIENLVKSDPRISQVVVLGDRKPYLVALITLADEALQWARGEGIAATTIAELSAHPRAEELVAGIIERTNRQLASYESIKKFRIVAHDFTQESGELTPSLKVKRNVVQGHHSALVEAMYAEPGPRKSEASASH